MNDKSVTTISCGKSRVNEGDVASKFPYIVQQTTPTRFDQWWGGFGDGITICRCVACTASSNRYWLGCDLKAQVWDAYLLQFRWATLQILLFVPPSVPRFPAGVSNASGDCQVMLLLEAASIRSADMGNVLL